MYSIENGLPYLVFEGRAYAVKIEGTTVTIDHNSGRIATSEGTYTLEEVIAKLGGNVSSIKSATRKTTKKG